MKWILASTILAGSIIGGVITNSILNKKNNEVVASEKNQKFKTAWSFFNRRSIFVSNLNDEINIETTPNSENEESDEKLLLANTEKTFEEKILLFIRNNYEKQIAVEFKIWKTQIQKQEYSFEEFKEKLENLLIEEIKTFLNKNNISSFEETIIKNFMKSADGSIFKEKINQLLRTRHEDRLTFEASEEIDEAKKDLDLSLKTYNSISVGGFKYLQR